MVKPFITVDSGNLKAQIDRVNNSLDRTAEVVIASTERAMIEIAEDMLSKAQAKMANNVRSGDLIGSGFAFKEDLTGAEIVVKWGFNKEYARIRDQGGDIFPSKAKLLAIPLDPIMTATGPRFASPREEPNLELVPILQYLFLADKDTGEFHWLLTPHVHQEGSHYASSTVQEEAQNVAPTVARRVGELLESGGPK